MKWVSSIVALVGFCVLSSPALGAQEASTWNIAPPPGWVVPSTVTNFNNNRFSATTSGSHAYLLFEEQAQIESQDRYFHSSKVILNASGLQEESSLSTDFDPSYQHLTLHSARIRRGTNRVEQLKPSRVKVVQRERDLDRNVYDGSLSAVIFLEDVRVGDIIDYEYTIHGFNPIHKGRHAGIYNLQWGVPVAMQRYRMFFAKDRKLYVRQHNGAAEPRRSEVNGTNELVWEVADIPAMQWEDSVPRWFDPRPRFEVSEYQTWHEVAVWASSFYSTGQ
ncbi:MAG: hypothetical protein JWO95_3036, partial [Verrucomicrobiales bacterium]|nr:hypothetical protein [Verrucomicrobiales bacterium]